MTNEHEIFMQRCFDLARLGAGQVSPNPMVGAVLVHEGRIIGEGWHQRYGQAHAEVNAVANVRPEDVPLICKSTLYVSLEPCCIFGKTPPCTNLILQHRIPKVVVSCLDLTPEVSGNGIGILKKGGVEVTVGILQKEGERLVAIRNTFVNKKRPFIFLKFAQSKDGFMGQPGKQVWISNAFSNKLAHKWRSELDAILVGTRTALTDNPSLNNRHWTGKSPIRVLLDRNLVVPENYNLLSGTEKTLVVTAVGTNLGGNLKLAPKLAPKLPPKLSNVEYLPLAFDENLLPNLFRHFYEEKITSLLVEGGAETLRHFIENDWWDEAAVFTGPAILGTGIPAPRITGELLEEARLGTDSLTIWRNLRQWR